MNFSRIPVKSVKDDPQQFIQVPRQEWEKLRTDVQELKEMVSGMASALSAVADGAGAFLNSPMGKVIGNLFPESEG